VLPEEEEEVCLPFCTGVEHGLFVTKRRKDIGWGIFHNEELHNLYTSLNIVGMVKLKRIRWTGRVARMKEKCANDFGGNI